MAATANLKALPESSFTSSRRAVIQELAKSILIDGLFNCDRSYLYTNGWKEELRYRCPSCEDRFPKVSGLLQHIETTACAATYSGILEKLRRYIKQQVQDVLG